MPHELKPCGTDAAYMRHRRAGEDPCEACKAAHAAAGARRRDTARDRETPGQRRARLDREAAKAREVRKRRTHQATGSTNGQIDAIQPDIAPSRSDVLSARGYTGDEPKHWTQAA